MKINLRTFLMAGSALVAAAAFAPGTAFAQCATTGVLAADCDFEAPQTTGAITLNTGVDVTFASAGQTLVVNDAITGAAAGDGTLATDGLGTNVLQEANIGAGAGNAIGGLTIGSGDIWYLSGASINLLSTGTFTINGGTLSFASGGGTLSFSSGGSVAGGASADTIEFISAGDGSQNLVFASSINLAGGDDVINFESGNGVIFASSLSMGAGNDTITFVSGQIDTTSGGAGSGTVDLGTGNDTVTFVSAPAGTPNLSAIDTLGFDAGDGNDTVTFNSGGTIDVNGGDFDMGAGTDTVTFNSGGAILNAANILGGTGTDTVNFNSGTYTTGNADITGVEAFNAGDLVALTIGGSVTGGTITLNSGSSLTINDGNAGNDNETVTSTITGATGGAQTVTITNGTVSGNISLGDMNDTINYQSGSVTGTMALGTGNDVLNAGAGASVEIGSAVTGLEGMTVSGNTVTVSAAITGLDDTFVAGTSGIDVNANTLIFNDGGSFDGAIDDGAGTGLVDFGNDTLGGTFNAGGTIDTVGLMVTSGTLDTNGFAFGSAGALDTLTIGDGASTATLIASDNVTVGGGGDDLVLSSATLRIAAGATVQATGFNQVQGDGTFIIEVANTASGFSVGSLNVTGEGLDFDNGELFQIVVGSGSLAFSSGDVITFASGGAALAGGPAAINVSDTSFLYDFTIGANGNGTALDILVAQSGAFSTLTTTSNNNAAATVLLTDPVIAASTDANVLALIGAVAGAPTQLAFNEALEQAQPTVDGSNYAAAFNVVNTSFNVMGDRLASLRTGDDVTGMASGNVTQGVRAWTQAFGTMAQQDDRDGIDGYDADTYGAAVGLDTENLGQDMVLGAAVSYANTNADSANASNTDTDVDSYQFTVYGDRDIDDRTYVNGMFAYTYNDIETSRDVVAATAVGDYSANQYTARGEVGREYAYSQATITPHVLGHWTHFDPDSYTETGAGGAGLTVDGESMDIAELGIGSDIDWMFKNSDGSYFSPVLKAEYRYDFVGDDIEMTSQFVAGGATFQTQGFDAQRHTFDVGGGFTYYTTENWELTAEYNYEWKGDYDSHSGLVRAAYRF